MLVTTHSMPIYHRTSGLALVILLAACLAPLDAQVSGASRRAPWNFIDEIALPPDRQHSATKGIVAQLAGSRIPTAKDARSAVMGVRGYLGADEAVEATGLFYVDATSLNAGDSQRGIDIVWQVSFLIVGFQVRSVYWISARTGAVMLIVPRPAISN